MTISDALPANGVAQARLAWTRTIGLTAGPRYLAIVRAVEVALDNGSLKPGDRLPPQRDLARHLALNIGTISRAYATMQDSGLVSGEVGRGTFINRVQRADGPRSLWDHSAPRPFVDLSHSFPDDAPLHPAIMELMLDWPAPMDVPSLLARQIDAGLPRHREAGARWLERFGIHCDPDDVIVTCGAQHGLLLAMAALSRPGDLVLSEELAFYGLRSAASMMGRSLVGVRMDAEGLMPDYLDIACRRTGAKLLFCNPTLHNPTNATMSLARRQEVLEVCGRHDVTIIEDDVWNIMPDEPSVPFVVLDPVRAVYVTSFSKVIGPGIRVGLLRVPCHARHAFGVALRATTLMASPLNMEQVVRLIASARIDGVLRAVRSEARARQSIVSATLPAGSVIAKPESFFAWLKLTNGWSAEAFTRAAETRGVGVTPFSVFEVASLNHTDAVRICTNGAPNRGALAEALGQLRDLLREGSATSASQHAAL